MKKLNYILLAAALWLPAACADFLDKEADTELTLEMVFNDRVRMEGWLGNAYSYIPRPAWDYVRNICDDTFGDDVAPNTGWGPFWGQDAFNWQRGAWSSASGQPMRKYWVDIPKYIRTAYLFMENVQPLPAQGISEEEVTLMKAECRFLAANYWWMLLNAHGAIPFRPDYIMPTDAEIADLQGTQTPFDEVVSWLDAELLALSEILPAKYAETQKYGRATGIMCLAVRARMLLFAASPLVNGNADYADYVNSEGVPIFNSTPDPTKWKRAADACALLIDKAHAAGHELYKETNADGSIDPFMSCQNLWLSVNSEQLFVRPQEPDAEYERHSFARAANGNGGLGATQLMVDAFFTKNGLPITDAQSGYSETGLSASDDVRVTKWNGCERDGDNGIIAKAGVYNMYANREPRFYLAVWYNGVYLPNPHARRAAEFFLNGRDNDGTHDAPETGYLLRKKHDPGDNIQTGQFNNNRPDIHYRLAEAYLNYAEALNESDEGRNINDVLTYLNLVRERAGVRQYKVGSGDNDYIGVADNKDAVRNIIRLERHAELCAEGGIRYFDLRRWKTAEQVLSGDFYGMNRYGTDANAFYQRTSYLKRGFPKAFYWYPIAQEHIDENPNLKQMPYWN
jgi:hypothetical protein